MDLSETTEHHGDGSRTPRPGNLTPSPPRSRAGSVDDGGGGGDEDEDDDEGEQEEGDEVDGRCKGNGKRTLDEKGRLWKEDEGEVARLMRTVDFAARVSSDDL